MNDEYEETEIAVFCTGIAIGDEFFAKQESMTEHDLAPAFCELNHKCAGLIKEPGIYSLTARIVRIK